MWAVRSPHAAAARVVAAPLDRQRRVNAETLKQRDWLISSPEEERRQQGVAAVKRSIELAGRLSVRTVVVHCGQVALEN